MTARLQPGRCSASSSSSITWLGAPGAAQTTASCQFFGLGGRFGPPAAANRPSAKHPRQPHEPFPIRRAVVIGEGEDFVVRCRGAGIAGGAQAAGIRVSTSAPGEIVSATNSAVPSPEPSSTTMVSKQPSILLTAIRQLPMRSRPLRVQMMTEKWEPVAAELRRKMKRRQRGFVVAVAVGQAEIPVEHFGAVVPPAVAPGVEGETGGFLFAGDDHVPSQRPPPAVTAVSPGIQSELGDHQRPVAGDVLEAFDIFPECVRLFEVDVEGGEIGVFRFEVFGARVVGVGEEQVRCDLRGRGRSGPRRLPAPAPVPSSARDRTGFRCRRKFPPAPDDPSFAETIGKATRAAVKSAGCRKKSAFCPHFRPPKTRRPYVARRRRASAGLAFQTSESH